MWDFQKYASNRAVITETEQLTYADLMAEGEALCNAMDGRCLVFSLCGNVIESLIGYTAFLQHGIVSAMLQGDLDSEMLLNLYHTYQPCYVWCQASRVAEFGQTEAVYKSRNYQLLRTPFEGPALHENLALLLTTSGSTGSPKFVRQSYANIRANTDSIVDYLHLTAAERPITTLPMNYTYGISILNTHLDVGACILLTDKSLMQKEFWHFFKEYGATSFGGVPYTYEMLKRLRIFRMELPTLHTMTQAGGKLLPALHKEFALWAQETGREFVVMYGQCEATARMAYLPAEKSLEKFGCMGIAIPGGRFALAGADGGEMAEPDITGELIYYGANVTLGYAACAADLAKGDERNGRLETGDMAQMDADGYFRIVGRKKRFLKLFGSRVNLDEAEQLLKAAFPDVECACAGVDDKLTIYTTCEEKEKEMCAFLAGKMGFHPSAFTAKYIKEIPKNEAGKTLYRELE